MAKIIRLTESDLTRIVRRIKEEEKLNIKEYFGGDENYVSLPEEGLNLSALLDGLSVLRANHPVLYYKYFPNIYNV